MKRKGIFDEFFKEFEEMDEVFEKLFEGIPRVKHFGNVKPELPEEPFSETKEPFCDVIYDEKENEAIITLEMPGIEKKDINIEATEDTIEVKAETESRSYNKKLDLEKKIKRDTIKAVYNNGVLEIKAKLKEPMEKKVKKVEVK